MNATFKSGVEKMENQCYKINNRPVSLNEGNYRVNFEIIDKKPKKADFSKKPLTEPKKRFFKVAPCSTNNAVCSLQSRKAAKQEHPLGFNSALQYEEQFVNQGRFMGKKYQSKRLNIPSPQKEEPIKQNSIQEPVKQSSVISKGPPATADANPSSPLS